MFHPRNTQHSVFTGGKGERSPQLSQQQTRRTDEQLSARLHHEQGCQQNRAWFVRAKENTIIAPRCRQIIVGRLEAEKEQNLPPLVCVEPAQIPIEGIFPARALSRVSPNAPEPSRVKSRLSCSETGTTGRCACVMVANFSNEALTIPKATVLGVAEEISESLVDSINSNSDLPVKPRRKRRNEALYQKLLQSKLDHLPLKEREITEPVLLKYAHVFHDEETNDFKGTDVIKHDIPVGDAQPIRRPPYRTPYALRGEMKAQVEDMLRKGVIRDSNSPWSAPAILVPKEFRRETQIYVLRRLPGPKFGDEV